MSASFESLQRGSGVVYGACGGIWVMMVFSPPSVADMELARPALRTMRLRHSGGFPVLTWVLPGAGLAMDGDARRAAGAVTKEFVGSFTAQATLIEGSGFQAATIRAIISGIDMLARSPAPKRVFGELAPSVTWCVANRPTSAVGSGDAVLAALESARTPFG